MGALLISIPVTPLLFAGVGPALGFGGALLIVLIASQVLPPAKTGPWMLIGLALGLVTLLLDLFGSADRLSMPQVQSFLGYFVLISTIVFVLILLRQFRTYNLQFKIVFLLLLVNMIIWGGGSLLVDRFTSQLLTANVGNGLHAQATTQALAIGDALAQPLNILRSAAGSQTQRLWVETANLRYGDDPAQIEADLAEFDQLWQSATAETSIQIRDRLNNPAAEELRNKQTVFPDLLELFVTDQHGGLVAAAQITSDYNQADEAWWQAAYNNGRGGIYLSDPEFDESANAIGLNMAVPMYDQQGNIIGIVRGTYRFSAVGDLLELLEKSGEQPGIHTDLLLADQRLFAPDADDFETAEGETLANLEKLQGVAFAEFLFEDERSLVSLAPVTSIAAEQAITDLGWQVIVHQPSDLALAPVEAQRRNLILIVVGAAVLIVAAAILVTQQITGPLTRLTTSAQTLAHGDLSSRTSIKTGDEIEVLADTFNGMADSLQELVGSLEDRVAQRTRQFETLVEIGGRLSAILSLEELMHEVVVLGKETFKYYHVQIYLLDETNDTLTLAEGYGEAGAIMKQRGHQIPMSATQSLVVRAARDNQAVLVNNVRETPDWLPNDLLPDTSAEIAAPIVLDEAVVGVLDVQADRQDHFDATDANLLRSLANQIAVAMRNVRLFAQVETSLAEAREVQARYIDQAWGQRQGQQQIAVHQYQRLGASVPDEATSRMLEQAAAQKAGAAVVPLNGQAAETPHSAIVAPIKVEDIVIGTMEFHETDPDRGHQWSEQELAFVQAIASQVAQAAENLRLFDQTQERASRETTIREITDKLRAASSLDALLETAARELSDRLDIPHTVVEVGIEASSRQPEQDGAL